MTAAEAANLIQGTAIVAAFIGVIATIFWSNRIAWKRATLDLILSELVDPRQVELREKFIKLLREGDVEKYMTLRNDPNEEISADAHEKMNILGVNMNIYEMIAIGINKKIMDEKSYKDWARSAVVDDWLKCKTLVSAMRNKNGRATYYQEFEKLACRWAEGDEITKCNI